MAEHVGNQVVIVDMCLYWLLTILILAIMDFYAKRKMGKSSLGFQALRIPKFIALCGSSGFTILFVVISIAGVTVSQQVLTYFGVPYFAIWIFYISHVFRRVKAEKTRRLR